MIIKVVSLKQAIDRRKYIFKKFSNLRLIYDFVDAIEPSTCSEEILSNFNSSQFKNLYGRSPTLAEIGASLSHHLARKKFLEESDQKTLLVLEDDAKIMCTKDELFSIVKVFEQSKFDILILGFSKCDDEFEKHINTINPILPMYKAMRKISIGPRYLHTTSGTVGYLVNRRSSKKMSNISKISVLSDDWGYFSKLDLKIAYTNPMIIRENFTELSSQANHNNFSQVPFKDSRNWISLLVFLRKHFYGLYRKILLYFIFILYKK